jgi:hypothetical protein
MSGIPRLIPWIRRRLGPQLPICCICGEPVEIATKTTDENGKAIHEECDALKTWVKRTNTPPGNSDSKNFPQ